MAHGTVNTRYFNRIRNVKQLRQARRELDFMSRYARRRLSDDVADTFSPEGLLSMLVPPGSAIDRVIGGIGTGLSTVRGIAGILGKHFGGRCGGRE